MSAIIQFVPPAELLFQPTKKESLFANREPKPVRLSPSYEPEQRLWKLSAQAVSSRFAVIEIFVLMLFLAVALAGIIGCFAELSHLLESDAVGHVAMRVVSGGA